MLHKIFYHHRIPITHILIIATISIIVSITATMQGYSIIIPTMFGIAATYGIAMKNDFFILILAVCGLFATSTLVNLKYAYNEYQTYQQFLNKPLTIQGAILSTHTNHLTKMQTNMLIKTDKIMDRQGNILKAPRKLFITMPCKKAQNLQEGDHIKIYNIQLQQPPAGDAYEMYLIKEGIWATAFLFLQKIEVKKQQNFTLRKTFLTHIQQFNISKKLEDLFNPLFLGKREKNINTISIQHNSLYWGIAHHMARSGIHLVTIFGLLMLILHCFALRPILRSIICTLIIIGYFEITYATISIIRALCMLLMQLLCKIHKFNYSSMHALTLTALLVVIYNPLQIFFLDFQLSFGITAVIIWLFNIKYSKTIAFSLISSVPSKT